MTAANGRCADRAVALGVELTEQRADRLAPRYTVDTFVYRPGATGSLQAACWRRQCEIAVVSSGPLGRTRRVSGPELGRIDVAIA